MTSSEERAWEKVSDLEDRIADLEKENTELKSIAEFQQSSNMKRYFEIQELKKENAELKEELKDANEKVVHLACNQNKDLKYKLAKAKELLTKWVELFEPKSGDIPPTPIQVDTEQFLRKIEK